VGLLSAQPSGNYKWAHGNDYWFQTVQLCWHIIVRNSNTIRRIVLRTSSRVALQHYLWNLHISISITTVMENILSQPSSSICKTIEVSSITPRYIVCYLSSTFKSVKQLWRILAEPTTTSRKCQALNEPTTSLLHLQRRSSLCVINYPASWLQLCLSLNKVSNPESIKLKMRLIRLRSCPQRKSPRNNS